MSDYKCIVWLINGTRHAVVIDWTPEDARRRAHLTDPAGGWEGATFSILTRIRASRMNRVVALERDKE